MFSLVKNAEKLRNFNFNSHQLCDSENTTPFWIDTRNKQYLSGPFSPRAKIQKHNFFFIISV